MKKKARSGIELIEGLTEFVDALKDGGDVRKQFTCHEVLLNLTPGAYPPKAVRRIRTQLGVSQPLFDAFLGVSVQSVRSWEQGVNEPSPMAARFLDEIANTPDHFKRRLVGSLVASKRQRK